MTIAIDLRGAPVRAAVCPRCGKVHTGAARSSNVAEIEATPARPSAGDLSICNRCGGVAEFTDAGELRAVDERSLPRKTRKLIKRTRKAARFVLPDTRRPLQ